MDKKDLDGEGRDFKEVPMVASSYGQFEMRVSDKSLNFGVKEKYTMDAVLESNIIQKEIRSRSIYVPHTFNRGTLKTSFLENSEGQRVFADSYGPFHPDEYFMPSTYRIMFILKESYFETAEEEENMTEGHNVIRS